MITIYELLHQHAGCSQGVSLPIAANHCTAARGAMCRFGHVVARTHKILRAFTGFREGRRHRKAKTTGVMARRILCVRFGAPRMT